MGIRDDVLRGLIAGGMGTIALNATTYLDMLLRGRPGSPVPAEMAQRTADAVGVALARPGDPATETNRSEGLGALLGYASGLGYGILYGLAWRHLGRPSVRTGAPGLMVVAMVGANVPATVLGITDPTEWGVEGWMADIVPHAVFGLVTAATYDAMSVGGGPR